MNEYGEALIWEMQDLLADNFIQTYEEWEDFTDLMCETAMNFFQDKVLEHEKSEIVLKLVK